MPERSATSEPERLTRLLGFLKYDPGNRALRKEAIVEARDSSQWPIAQQLIDAGLQLHGDDAELLAHAGFAHLQAQRYDAAVQALEAASALGIEPAEVRYNQAFALFMLRRYAQALELLSAPLLPFELPLVLPLRARCLHHLQRMEEAIADCHAHLQNAPDDADTRGLLALLFYDRSVYDEARESAEAALRHNSRQVEARLTLASLQLDARQFDSAKEIFEALLRDDPQCGRGWLGLALVEMNRTLLESALHDATQAATFMPDHIGTQHVLAWIHLLRNDVAAARAAFDRALQIDRNFGETHGGLATIAALEGRWEDAYGAIKRALRLDPQSLSARYAQLVMLKRA